MTKNYRDASTGQYTTAADAAARPAETVAESVPTRHETPDVAELRRLLEGRICEARFSDGAFHGAACGLEGCECPEHEWEAENPTPAGTYLTLRLTEDAPVRLGASQVLLAPDAALDLAEALDALRAELAHMTEARDNARAEVERLTAMVRRVQDLHRESRGSLSALYPNPICECGKDYPCPTIRALGGES